MNTWQRFSQQITPVALSARQAGRGSSRGSLQGASQGYSQGRGGFSVNPTLNLLRRFEPMAQLDWHSLATLARQANELVVPANRLLVKPPRRLRGVWYLCSGSLQCELTGQRLKAGSARCRLPVYPGFPALRTRSTVRLLWFADEVLEALPDGLTDVLSEVWSHSPDQENSASSVAVPGSGQWLEVLAASPALRLLYASRGALGWQQWLRELEPVPVGPQVELIAAGQQGDSFYVVQTGVAQVVPAAAESRDAAIVVNPGGFFGEDAVLSGQRRNARITMPDGGVVLRGSALHLHALVDDLWWALAATSNSWRPAHRVLNVRGSQATVGLRRALSRLPKGHRYGLRFDRQLALQDLVLLWLVHRGHEVALQQSELASAAESSLEIANGHAAADQSGSLMQTLKGSAV